MRELLSSTTGSALLLQERESLEGILQCLQTTSFYLTHSALWRSSSPPAHSSHLPHSLVNLTVELQSLANSVRTHLYCAHHLSIVLYSETSWGQCSRSMIALATMCEANAPAAQCLSVLLHTTRAHIPLLHLLIECTMYTPSNPSRLVAVPLVVKALVGLLRRCAADTVRWERDGSLQHHRNEGRTLLTCMEKLCGHVVGKLQTWEAR